MAAHFPANPPELPVPAKGVPNRKHPHRFDCLDSLCDCLNIVSPIEGTASWLLSHERFQDWLTTPVPKFLWITGKPGSGKSVLAKYLVENLSQCSDKSSTGLKAHFFFAASQRSSKTTPTHLLRSLLSQVQVDQDRAYPVPSLGDIEAPPFPLVNDSSTLKQLLWKHLHEVTKTRTVTLIIDGLDEIGHHDAIDILTYFRKMIRDTRFGKLRICLSSRPHDLPRNVEDYPIFVDEENGGDITAFMWIQIMKHYSRSQSTLNPQELIDNILSKSSGMFVWAAIVLQYALANRASDKDLTTLVTTLPPDLESVYDIICSQMMIENRRQDVVQLMSFIALAKRPLTTGELCDALNFKNSNEKQVVPGLHWETVGHKHQAFDVVHSLQELTYG